MTARPLYATGLYSAGMNRILRVPADFLIGSDLRIADAFNGRHIGDHMPGEHRVRIGKLYPRKAGSRFDMEYYLNVHMPMSIERLGTAKGFVSITVEEGVSGAEPGSESTCIAMCDYLFESPGAFMDAFSPHAMLLQGDMIHYTDMEPVVQVTEVRICKL